MHHAWYEPFHVKTFMFAALVFQQLISEYLSQVIEAHLSFNAFIFFRVFLENFVNCSDGQMCPGGDVGYLQAFVTVLQSPLPA